MLSGWVDRCVCVQGVSKERGKVIAGVEVVAVVERDLGCQVVASKVGPMKHINTRSFLIIPVYLR